MFRNEERSLSEDKKELRTLSESWIVVVTIILGIAFVIITLSPPENVRVASLLGYLLWSAIILCGSSLSLFLLARDPRQKHDVSKLIDGGVTCLALSIILGGIYVGLRQFYVNGDIYFTIFLTLLTIGGVLFFYPFIYYRSRKKLDTQREN